MNNFIRIMSGIDKVYIMRTVTDKLLKNGIKFVIRDHFSVASGAYLIVLAIYAF